MEIDHHFHVQISRMTIYMSCKITILCSSFTLSEHVPNTCIPIKCTPPVIITITYYWIIMLCSINKKSFGLALIYNWQFKSDYFACCIMFNISNVIIIIQTLVNSAINFDFIPIAVTLFFWILSLKSLFLGIACWKDFKMLSLVIKFSVLPLISMVGKIAVWWHCNDSWTVFVPDTLGGTWNVLDTTHCLI